MDKKTATRVLINAKYPSFTVSMQEYLSEIRNEYGGPPQQLKLVRMLWHRFAEELEEFLYAIQTDPYDSDEFVVATEAGLYQLTRAAEIRLQEYVFEAGKYGAELTRLNQHDFMQAYSDVFSLKRETEVRQAREQDAFAFFSFPDARVDAHFWLSLSSWTEEEAVAISMGKDPRVVNSISLSSKDVAEASPFAAEYRRRLAMIKSAVQAGDCRMPLRPASTVAYLRDTGAEINDSLDMGASIKATAQSDSEWEKQYNRIERDFSEYRLLNDDVFLTRTGEPKKKTYLRVLLGMAIARFEHQTSGQTSATSQIEEGLIELERLSRANNNVSSEDLKIALDNGTIGKVLVAAARQLEVEWKNPIRWSGVLRKPSK